ncbi:hypothetical protein ACLK1T_25395 [Escherichia coli]
MPDYQPLRDAIVAQRRERLNDKATAVLDIGCGKGINTRICRCVARNHHVWSDVSKVAIKAAAKRYPQVTFCVVFQPPFAVFRYQYGRHNTYLRAV